MISEAAVAASERAAHYVCRLKAIVLRQSHQTNTFKAVIHEMLYFLPGFIFMISVFIIFFAFVFGFNKLSRKKNSKNININIFPKTAIRVRVVVVFSVRCNSIRQYVSH